MDNIDILVKSAIFNLVNKVDYHIKNYDGHPMLNSTIQECIRYCLAIGNIETTIYFVVNGYTSEAEARVHIHEDKREELNRLLDRYNLHTKLSIELPVCSTRNKKLKI